MTTEARAFHLLETTIGAIQAAYKGRVLSARELVELYVKRIEAYDSAGPRINSIITLNPMALEEADERRVGRGDTGPQEERCVGPGDERALSEGAGVAFRRVDELVPVAAPARRRVDGEEAHVSTVVALDRGDHADARVATDDCGLVRCEQRPFELLDRRRTRQCSRAQRGDVVKSVAS